MAQILKSRNLAPGKVYTVSNPGNVLIVNSSSPPERPSASSLMNKLKTKSIDRTSKLSTLKCAGRVRSTQY